MEDWGAIIKKAETERFVGRAQELEAFQHEIALAVPGKLVYYLTGQGGVGKTTLLRRYQELARNSGFLVVECSEQQKDVSEVLGRFAQQLAAQHAPLEAFEKRYRVYQQHLREIENDPEAPQGLAAFLGRTAVRTTYLLGDMVPGLRKGLEYTSQEAVETHVSDWMVYLSKRMSNKEDAILMRDPVAILTPLFFEDLNRLAAKQRLLLCFENFEATRPELQGWLLRLPEYRPSRQIRLAIAGREPLAAAWDPLRLVTKVVSLDVFSAEEAEQFLDAYGILDQKRRTEILHWSGCLPVLMSWLATPQGKEPDPSLPLHDIVERFLRWVTEPGWREIALLVAFPHTFNLDLLNALLPQGKHSVDEQAAFAWLQSMPFVQSRAGGWQYHPVVRRMMLRYQRQTSPRRYSLEHTTLATWYQNRYQKQILEKDAEWANEQWRKDVLEYLYHCLSADPLACWEECIEWFVIALRKRRMFAGDIIEMLYRDEAQDELSLEQYKVVQLLYEQFQIVKEEGVQSGRIMFEHICTKESLSPTAKGYVFAFRGESYRVLERYAEALSDLDRAIGLDEKDSWAITVRGETYRQMGRYAEALSDFDRAIELDEKDDWAIAQRGQTYRVMGRYEEALVDFERAIALNEKYDWAIAQRGGTYRAMGRYEEALVDFERAIALDEKYDWAIAQRGETYRIMGRYEEALVDFERAIALDEKASWAIGSRGQVYQALGRYTEALADFDRAIALDETHDWAIGSRGETYRQMGRYAEALADFNRAIELDGQYGRAIAERGETYKLMKRYAEALADFSRAIELDEQYGWAIAERGETYKLMKRYAEALADFNRAIELDEKDFWAIAQRGQTYKLMGRYAEALADFSRAIELDEQYGWAIARRGQMYRLMGRYAEALVDFDLAIRLDEKYAWAIAQRGETYRLMRKYPEALVNFDLAIRLDEKYAWAIAQRGETYRLMGKHAEALVDFDRAIALDEKDDWTIGNRGETYKQMGRYAEALSDFGRVIALDEASGWYHYNRAQISYLLQQESAYKQDMERAIELEKQNRLSPNDIADTWRCDFNLAIFALFLRSDQEAQRSYERLIAACPLLSSLQEALEDLADLCTVQPQNPFILPLQQKLQARIQELR